MSVLKHSRNYHHTAFRVWNVLTIFAVSSILILGACAKPNTSSKRNGTSGLSAAHQEAVNSPALAEIIRISNLPVDAFRTRISNTTTVSFNFGHGTQIEHLDADGGAHLWYPGNRRMVHGLWEVRDIAGRTNMCFKYGSNTYNPETQQSGGSWECSNLHNYIFFNVDSQQGDPFGLQHTELVPQVMEKNAVKPYIPAGMPFQRPHRTNGKTPAEHLLEDFGMRVGT